MGAIGGPDIPSIVLFLTSVTEDNDLVIQVCHK